MAALQYKCMKNRYIPEHNPVSSTGAVYRPVQRITGAEKTQLAGRMRSINENTLRLRRLSFKWKTSYRRTGARNGDFGGRVAAGTIRERFEDITAPVNVCKSRCGGESAPPPPNAKTTPLMERRIEASGPNPERDHFSWKHRSSVDSNVRSSRSID